MITIKIRITIVVEKQSKKPDKNQQKPTSQPDPNYWDYCDNCGTKMITRACKLICPKCGFFRSCEEP